MSLRARSKVSDNGSSRRFLVAATSLAVSMFMLSACSSPDDASSAPSSGQSAGTSDTLIKEWNEKGVTIAVGSSLPNSSINTDGSPAGVEPEVTVGVLNAMGIDNIKVVQVDYETMIPGLQASQFDIVAGAIYMNDKRCEAAAISEPIVTGTYSFLYPASLTTPPATLEELAQATDLKVGIISGSQQLKAAINAGISEDRILEVTNVRDEVEALQQGRVDITIDNTASLKATVDDDTSVTVSERVTDLPRVGSGAIFRPADAELRDAFNQALADFKKDGSYAAIAKEYGVDPSVTLDGPTAEELCKNPG